MFQIYKTFQHVQVKPINLVRIRMVEVRPNAADDRAARKLARLQAANDAGR